jgi:chromosome segregation ATPase
MRSNLKAAKPVKTVNSSKPMKCGTIMNRYKKNGKLTLEDMAEEYGMEFQEFLEKTEKVVGRENFASLQNLDAKRVKRSKKNSAKTSTKTKDETKNEEPKKTVQPEKPTEKKSNKNSDNLADLQVKKDSILTQIESIKATADMSSELLRETKDEITTKEKELEELKGKATKLEEKILKANTKLQDYSKELEGIEAQISDLTEVYLLAPGFKGKLPTHGKIISNDQRREGVVVEAVAENEYVPASLEAMEKAGFDSLAKYKVAHSFVQLVAKYITNEIKYKLLNNSTQVEELIKIELEGLV